ncbi:MAG: hypothetical protein FI725_06225 [SAR202 cluster bacterium]|nr:hypothetical protein [SAR202 cluster bacterium]
MRKVLLLVLGLVSVAIVSACSPSAASTPVPTPTPTHTYAEREVISLLKDRLSTRTYPHPDQRRLPNFMVNCLAITREYPFRATPIQGFPPRWKVVVDMSSKHDKNYEYIFYERTGTFEMTEGYFSAC